MALESQSPTETLLYLYYYFFYFEKPYLMGFFYPNLPASDRDSAFCHCPVCLSFHLLKAFCNKDMERGGFV